MARTPNIFDAGVEPNLEEHDSMTCVYGQRVEDDERINVLIKENWPGGAEVCVDCDDDYDAQQLIDAIGKYANRGLVHLIFNT